MGCLIVFIALLGSLSEVDIRCIGAIIYFIARSAHLTTCSKQQRPRTCPHALTLTSCDFVQITDREEDQCAKSRHKRLQGNKQSVVVRQVEDKMDDGSKMAASMEMLLESECAASEVCVKIVKSK